jgi:hypothetical protein
MSDSHGAAGLGFGGLIGALLTAAFIAILADLMTPYGPVVLTLAIGALFFAIVTGVLSILPPLAPILRPAATIALVQALACGVFIGLWYIAPKPVAVERGVTAALLPFGTTLQAMVVRDEVHTVTAAAEPSLEPAAAPAQPAAPTMPMDEKQKALLNALASTDPAVRLRAGVSALNERDPAALAGVLETLYRSPDAAIRQIAVKRLIAQRRGARIPLIATPNNTDAQALANALQASGLTVRTINETSGAFDGGVCGPTGMTGAVNRSGVTMSGKCKVGDAEQTVVLTLTPTDDFQLSGEARDDKGRVARVSAPLL